MAKGFIKLHRQLTDHWLYKDRPFDRTHAWIDLLFLASWKDSTRDFKGQPIGQKRGEVVTSVKALSIRWGWSEGKVRRYLDALEKDGICTKKRLSHGMVLTIEKYGYYQDARRTNGSSHGSSGGSSDGDNRRIDKEYKECASADEGDCVDVASLPREEVEELERLLGRKLS